MISLNTDVNNLILQRTLLESSLGLNQTINRLTTGYKLNNAKDNAAGYSIIENLNTKISSMLQVEQNAGDGLAMLNITQGGIDQILEQLQRLRALAIDSANGTYDAQSREAMQVEADSILKSIEKVKNSTQYDNKSLFQSVSWVDCDSIPANTNFSLYTPTDGTQVLRTPEVVGEYASGEVQVMLSGTEINGSVEIGAKQSKTVTIDGVKYKFTNKDTTVSSTISWSKDTTTGVLTFNSTNFIIEGQRDVVHNIVIKGGSNYVWGGDLDDIIQEYDSTGRVNYLYGDGGNDTLTILGMNSAVYGGDGNDILTKESTSTAGSVRGGNGDDTITVNSTSWGTVISGEEGNDIFNFSSNSTGFIILGGAGDDTFNFAGTREQKLDGGAGTNIINGSPSNTSTLCNTTGTNNGVNVIVSANSSSILTIDGKNYEIKNNSTTTAYGVLASVVDGTVQFSHYTASTTYHRADTYFQSLTTETALENVIPDALIPEVKLTIKGEVDKAHNVKLVTTDLEFIGGNLDDTITLAHAGQIGRGGDGNDNIILAHDRTAGYGDDGDDTISSTSKYTSIYGGAGNDTLSSNSGYSGIVDIEGSNTISQTATTNAYTSDNSTSVMLGANETKNIVIGGKNYIIKNFTSFDNAILYKYDSTTGVVEFYGQRVLVQGGDNQEHNLVVTGHSAYYAGGNMDDTVETWLYEGRIYGLKGDDKLNINGLGNTYAYGGSGNDILTLEQQAYTYGESGNDIFNINYATSGTTVDGGIGNDVYNVDYTITNLKDSVGNNTYYVNANNTMIVGGSNKDTFYITSSGNDINGGNGDDHFVINNTGTNKINGADGINTVIDNSAGGATLLNVSSDNTGTLNFYAANDSQTLIINGITYTVTNTSADGTSSANNSVMYSYHSRTGELRLEGSGFTVSSSSSSKVLVRGDNNRINGTNGNDSITIESGSNNIVDAGDGNDSITIDSEENSVIGGAGADTIALNATTTKLISGGDGNDTLVLNSSNNTNINLGDGNNILRGVGSSNVAVLGNGANTVNIDGNFNNITAASGDDKIAIKGNENEIDSGDGKNTVSITGSKNVSVLGSGNDTVNITGNTNEVITGDGADNIRINRGDSNIIDGGNGEDRLIDKGSNTTRSNVLVQKVVPFKLRLKIDTGYDDNSFIKSDLDLSILDLEIDLTTQASALDSLERIDEAILSLQEKSVEIGSIMNRIECVMDYQSSVLNSLVSTRSTFRDADIAEESAQYIRYQILQQASATLMSSSRNLKAENVLGLLSGLNK